MLSPTISLFSPAHLQGEIELDYSTFIRPPGHAEAISDHEAQYDVQVTICFLMLFIPFSAAAHI
jgi:hypothetical protein